MANETKWIRAINFDLEKDKLKAYYPGKDYRHAYRDIKKFLKNNGFVHRQWSGYRSLEKLEDKEILALISKLKERFEWLPLCARRFDVTNVMNVYDLIPALRGQSLTKDKDVSFDEFEVDLSSPDDVILSKSLSLKEKIKLSEEKLKSK